MSVQGFLRSFERETKGLDVSPGAAPGCPECLACDCPTCADPESLEACTRDVSDEWRDLADEGSFSWRECDTCGSRLGGNRFPSHGVPLDDAGRIDRGAPLIHLDSCADCILYMANGDVPEVWGRTSGGVGPDLGLEDLRDDYRGGYDPGDAWGSCMGYRFEVADELERRGSEVPEAWQYRAGAAGPPDRSGDWPVIEDASDDALVEFGDILARHASRIRARGDDY